MSTASTTTAVSGAAPADGAAFTANEIRSAEVWLDKVARHPIVGAIRFRNALLAFVRGVDRSQSVTTPLKIMAVDTTEVFALANYDESSLKNFTFDHLFGSEQPQKDKLKALDRLINQHLLVGREKPFLMLPSHADEVMIIRQAKSNMLLKDSSKIREEDFGKLSQEQRLEIIEWFNKNTNDPLEKRWRDFKIKYLPKISDKFLDNLIKNTRAANSFDSFMRHAPYLFIRPLSAGQHSLEKHVRTSRADAFKWNEYTEYCQRPDVRARAEQIIGVVVNLLDRVRVSGKSAAVSQDAIERDAMAFALVDLLNRFFAHRKADVRVDLITRSPSLHDVIASLPEWALHMTVRHPLFLPDIYEFDRTQLDRLGDALLRVDTVLASAIDIQSLTSSPSNGASDRDFLKEINGCAQDVVEVLEGALTVRQALESKSFDESAGDKALADRVKQFFSLVETSGIDGKDLFSSDLFYHLVERNRTLALFARHRIFSDDSEKIPFRLIDFFPAEESKQTNVRLTKAVPGRKRSPKPIEGFMPDVLMMARAEDGEFRRVFFIHSGRVARLLRSCISQESQPARFSPRLGKIPVGEMFSPLQQAHDTLTQRKMPGTEADDDVVFNLDATLLVAMAFAGRGRYDTAIALTSTVLHQVTSELRQFTHNEFSPDQLRERLAYRELFLFRHYCERALARRDFFSPNRRLADSKGSVEKNLARVQRDLDFATLMTEQVEQCAGHAQPAPAGDQLIRDGRLRLAHLGAWIDQFVMIMAAEGAVEETDDRNSSRARAHRVRLDIFTAAGLIKETALIAWTARQRREDGFGDHPNSEKLERYLAFLEVSSLQGVLMMFIIFMAYPISPPLHRLWLGDTKLEPERVLVFRDWQHWFERYCELDGRFQFAMRPRTLIGIVCGTLIEAAKLDPGPRRAPRNGSIKDPEKITALLHENIGKLRKLAGSRAASAGTGIGVDGSCSYGLVHILADALAHQTASILKRDPVLSDHFAKLENPASTEA